MKLLWFTWKDMSHPKSGGAERVNEDIAECLARDGHEVIILVAGFKNSKKIETRRGYTIIRLGNSYTVYWLAYRYYKKFLKGWADLVIDEMNTVPFFCKFYVQERNILICYQLCREIWFYQMYFPLSWIGFVLEPFYLWLLRDRRVITESESTMENMVEFGFSRNNISIIPITISLTPLKSLDDVEKFPSPTLLSLGQVREMKRTMDQIIAFEDIKKEIPTLRLIIAGSADGSYGRRVLRRIAKSQYADDILYVGEVNEARKAQLMQRSHLIVVTSVKEGWGLIVTESNSQGTPAVAYNVDGLRDSVRHYETGLLTQVNNPASLAKLAIELFQDDALYTRMRMASWVSSRTYTLENTYNSFLHAIKLVN